MDGWNMLAIIIFSVTGTFWGILILFYICKELYKKLDK